MYDFYAPTDEHVNAVKLYAIMFEAFAKANKGEAEQNKELLAEARSKIPELIKLAEKLKDDCGKSIEQSKDSE